MIDVYYIEDDNNIAQIVKEYLDKRGFKVSLYSTIESAKEAIQSHMPGLVLVDWNMPDGEGYTLCQWIRSQCDMTPIIFLTVRNDTRDIVFGFNKGADDYVVKPFEPKELIARIKAVLRRYERQDTDQEQLVFPGLVINKSNYTIRIQGKELELPPKELELLFFLGSNPNKVFTREQLLEKVWGFDFYGDTRTVDVHVKRLREKLEPPDNHWQLKTVCGVGYKFEVK